MFNLNHIRKAVYLKSHSFAVSVVPMEIQRNLSEDVNGMQFSIKLSKISACFTTVLKTSQPARKPGQFTTEEIRIRNSVVELSLCVSAIKSPGLLLRFFFFPFVLICSVLVFFLKPFLQIYFMTTEKNKTITKNKQKTKKQPTNQPIKSQCPIMGTIDDTEPIYRMHTVCYKLHSIVGVCTL